MFFSISGFLIFFWGGGYHFLLSHVVCTEYSIRTSGSEEGFFFLNKFNVTAGVFLIDSNLAGLLTALCLSGVSNFEDCHFPRT